MGLYKITRPDGSVEYTDLPSGPGRVDGVGERAPRTQDEQHKDYELAKSLIKEAQKRIPKAKNYRLRDELVIAPMESQNA